MRPSRYDHLLENENALQDARLTQLSLRGSVLSKQDVLLVVRFVSCNRVIAG